MPETRGCNLFVFHLPDDWTDEDLLEYFTPHGTVVSAKAGGHIFLDFDEGVGLVGHTG